jgi:hypothetical protein
MAITEDRSPKLIDGDTEVNKQGQRERLQGVDAREVAKVQTDKYGEESLSLPQVGAYAQTEAMQRLIEEGGFIYKNNTGEFDEYGREIIERYNERGDKLSEVAIATGILDPNLFTSADALQAKRELETQQELTGKPNTYQDIAQAAIQAKNASGVMYKGTSVDEATYNPDLHSGVAFRDHSRSLENESLGFFGQVGDAWEQGWMGVREGLWGYLQAIGETTDIEMLDNLGSQGVLRAKDQMRTAPEIVLDYNEVDGFMSGFQYAMNNAAMSAPYMVTTFASLAAAVPATALGGPVAGAAVFGLPTSMIYAGQTWNEMEGERDLGSFAVASTVGVAAATLDRIGLSKIFSPNMLLSKQGVNRIAAVYANNNDISQELAKATILNLSKQNQAGFIKTIAKLTPNDIAKFSAARLGQAGLKGAAIESATEVMQESIQYGGAVFASDKAYDSDEYFNRIINAGIAGGVLGGGLGTAGNAYTQGKRAAWKTLKVQADADRQAIMSQQLIQDKNQGIKVDSVNELLDKDGDIERVFYNSDGTQIIGRPIKDNKGVETNQIQLSDGRVVTLNEDVFATSPYDASTVNEYNANTGNSTNKSVQIVGASPTKLNQLKAGLQKRLDLLTEEGLVDSPEAKQIKYQLQAIEAVQKQQKGDPSRPKEVVNNTTEEFSETHTKEKRGFKNFLSNNEDLKDYASSVGQGLARLVRAAERSMVDINKLVKSKTGLDIFARIGQVTTGAYHAGKNFKAFMDGLMGKYDLLVPEEYLGILFKEAFPAGIEGTRIKKHGITSKNVNVISKLIRLFMQPNDKGVSEFSVYVNWLAIKDTTTQTWEEFSGSKFNEKQANALYEAAQAFGIAYKTLYTEIAEEYFKETGKAYPVAYDRNLWWQRSTFDFKKVRKNKSEFKKWVRSNGFTEEEAEILYQNVAYRGRANFVKDYSLINGKLWLPPYLDAKYNALLAADVDAKYTNSNLFEPYNRAKLEAAKYISTTKYFGHGGRKLHALFRKLMREAVDNQNAENPSADVLSPDDVRQFAFYAKAIIDSTHGNFNTIDSPSWAAINRFLTSWSIFAGLPMSAISSIPETAMVYYGIKDDEEFKQGTNNLVKQIAGAWKKAADDEIKRTQKLMSRSGILDNVNTVIDRVSTGERDIAFVKAHEAFFRFIQIKSITQYQRRVSAAMGIDFVKSRISVLLMADMKDFSKDIDSNDPLENFEEAFIDTSGVQFNFDTFNAEEMDAYTSLADLGIDVEYLVELVMDVDNASRSLLLDGTKVDLLTLDENSNLDDKNLAILAAIKKRHPGNMSLDETLEAMNELQDNINEQLETAIYRFVNERVQNPQAANRPLFFQDPHYQLLTQFNGFISTFTAVVIPKMYNNYLRKGNPQMKYNTFALIVLMIALGGASQYLKDFLKFGKPSPYLDGVGYAQRALYSSGVLGQYERVVDYMYPLYPNRDDWLFTTLVGEAGPTLRNLQNVGKGVGQLITAEGQEDAQVGLGNLFRSAPGIAPFTGGRKALAKGLTGENPLPETTKQISELAGDLSDSLFR